MALSDKNIVITPNIGSSNDPQIVFSGADATTGAQNITAKVYPTTNGTLSFEGSAGQLFSITNSFTGTIFSVNDVSGIPSIEVFDTGEVRLAQYNGFVSVLNSTQATSTSTGALRVLGGAGIGGDLYVGGAIYGVGSISGTVTTATNIAGGANRQIVVQTGAGATGFITAPSATGQVLSWNGSAFVWTTTIVATQVNTIRQTGSATYYPVFVDADNASAAAESLYTSANLTINPSTGNVGIGTTPNATYKLAVTSTLPGAQSNKTIFNISDLYNAGANGQFFKIMGGAAGINLLSGWGNLNLGARVSDGNDTFTSHITIIGSGNVGIGTTTPSYKLQVVGGGVHAQAVAANGSPDSYADGGALMMSYASNTGSIRAYNNTSGTGTADIAFITAGTERLRIDSAGNFFFTGGSSQLNTGFTNKVNISGAIVAGTTASTGGSILMQGYYGSGATTNFGTEFSSGGPVIGYGVYPSNVGPGAFFSSSGLALTRGAYTIAGNQHNWYVGGAQTVAIGSAATLSLAMSLTSTGALAFNGAANYGTSGQVLQSNGNASPTWVNASSLPASSAAQVNTVLRTTNAAHYLTFVDSNNASSTSELVYTSVNFSVNPSTGMVSAPTFNATSVTDGGFQGIDTDTALLPSFTWSGDLNTGMWRPTADTVAFTTGGVEKVRITDIGRLGVGLTAPGSILETEENTTGVTSIRITNSNTGANTTKGSRLTFRISDTVGTRKDVAYISAIAINQDSSNGDHLAFSTRTADADPTEKLRILNTGAISFGATGTAYGSSGQILQSNGNASPTWVAPSSLSAGSAESATYILSSDDRIKAPADDVAGRMRFGFTSFANNNTSPYADYLHLRSYTDASGGNDNLVMFRKDAIGIRVWQQAWGSATAYATFKDVAFTDSSITGASGQVNTVLRTTNAAHYLAFVDSNNASATAESVYTSANFVVNPSTGNVGIGTSSPTSKLHVAGPGNTIGGNIHMGDNTNGAEKWSYLTGSHYNGATNVTGVSMIGLQSGASFNRVVIGGSIYESNPATEIQFWTHTATTHSLGGSQRMVIDTNGNVGIGTTAPDYKFEVITPSGGYATTVALQSDIGGTIAITGNANGATSRVGLIFRGSDKIGSAIASAREDPGATWKTYMAFYTNNLTGANVLGLQEKMRITADGAISFGATGTAYGTSGQLLQSNGNASPTWVNATGLTAGIAAQVNTVLRTTNADHYLTFVDSNNASATAESVYTSVNLYHNPSTGTFNAPTFNATSVTNGGFQGIDADTAAIPSFTWSADLNTGMWHPAADTIGFSTNGTERLRITSTGGISFGASGTAYGTSGQLLQSAGNAAPTWVNQSSIAAGSVPLTNTYVGFGSASNLLTGSSALTWSGSALNVSGNITFADTGGTAKRGIQGTVGTNDFWFVGGGSTASNAGYMEIATGDDGQGGAGAAEPIYISQYGPGDPLTGTLFLRGALLDASGNTYFPRNLGAGTTAPIGRLTVVSTSSTGAATGAWSSAYSVFGPNAASSTGAALGLGYNTTSGASEILSLAPAIAWRPLNLFSAGLSVLSSNGSLALTVTAAGGVAFGTSATAYGTSGQILQSNGNASPTWVNASGISAGSATSALYARVLQQTDGTNYIAPSDPRAASGGRGNNLNANQYAHGLFSEFKNSSLFGFTGNYTGLLTYANWVGTSASTGDPTYQLSFHPNGVNATANPRLKFRAGIDTTWGAWGEVSHTGVIDLNIRHNSIGLNQAAPGTAGAIAAPIRFVNRASFPASGISWYSPSYTSWSQYMSPAGATGAGPTGNITAPSGTLVTSWALRSFVENPSGYGWTFESGAATGQPTVVAEIRSSDGSAKFNGGLNVGTASGSVTGEIRASNEITAYYSSDIRLKENIRLIADPIGIINQIRGVYYDWTDDHIKARGGEDGYFVRKHDIGVIAQEVEKVLPEIVAERDDGTKVVKYEKIVALLIEAVKDQQQQINQILVQLENLTNK